MVTEIINKKEESNLINHIGHKIECVKYGKYGLISSLALECVSCNEVLFSEEIEDIE